MGGSMNIGILKQLAQINMVLPDNCYFAYSGQEIIEFHYLDTRGLELLHGSFVALENIDTSSINLTFESCGQSLEAGASA